MLCAPSSQTPPPTLETNPIEDLLAQESLSKLLSALYLALLSVQSSKMDSLWKQWHADIHALDRETWEECFEDSYRMVIASKDQLTQTKFLRAFHAADIAQNLSTTLLGLYQVSYN